MLQPRLSVLPRAQRWLWPRLSEIPPHFVLFGGTAIALRLAHRESIDFDLFSAQAFDPDALVASVPFLQLPKTVSQSQRNTYTAVLRHPDGDAKVSFFGEIALGQFFPPEVCADNHLKVASLEDMLAIKLKVIHQRVEAKDYFDIAAMLRAGLSLAEGVGRLDALFPNTINVAMTLQSLVYFSGGDLDALPAETKATLIDAVRRVCEVPQFERPRTPIGG